MKNFCIATPTPDMRKHIYDLSVEYSIKPATKSFQNFKNAEYIGHCCGYLCQSNVDYGGWDIVDYNEYISLLKEYNNGLKTFKHIKKTPGFWKSDSLEYFIISDGNALLHISPDKDFCDVTNHRRYENSTFVKVSAKEIQNFYSQR